MDKPIDLDMFFPSNETNKLHKPESNFVTFHFRGMRQEDLMETKGRQEFGKLAQTKRAFCRQTVRLSIKGKCNYFQGLMNGKFYR